MRLHPCHPREESFEVLVLLKDLHFILCVASFLFLNHFKDHCDVPHGKVVTRILGSCFSPCTSEFCFCNAVFKIGFLSEESDVISLPSYLRMW